MSAPMTDIPTSKTTNPTNLYTTRKSTKFYKHDDKGFEQLPRPSASKVDDGEKPPNCLYPSIFENPTMATEKCVKRFIQMTFDRKYKYLRHDTFYNTREATEFRLHIMKDSDYEIISTALFIAISSLTPQEIKDNIEEYDCNEVIGPDGEEYLEITPKSTLKKNADKALKDAIERNDGNNRGTATDADDFIIINLGGVKGKFFFRITYSSLILPSLSQDNDNYEQFVIGAKCPIAPGEDTHFQIILNDDTTFNNSDSKNLGDLLSNFRDTTILITSQDPCKITDVGLVNVIAIITRRKQIHVSLSDIAVLTYCGTGSLAVLDINLSKAIEPTKLATTRAKKKELKVCVDASGSMWENKTIRNNTTLGINKEVFDMIETRIADESDITIGYMAFDGNIIPEWSIRKSIVGTSDNLKKILGDFREEIDNTIKIQGARGSTDFTTCFDSNNPNPYRSLLLITDGCHNGSSNDDLLTKLDKYCKSAECLYIALLGIGPYADIPLLHKMAQVVHDNNHVCEVYSSTFFPGSDSVDDEVDITYNAIVDRFTSIIFEQNSYNILLPEGYNIIHADMNNHNIDGNNISFKASGGSIKLIVECPRPPTDDLKITVNDTELSCDIRMQANPHAMRNHLVTRKFYIEANDNDPRVKIVNTWLINNSLISPLISSEFSWHQNFGGKVATVATKYEDGIPKLNIPPMIPTPIAPNAVLTTLTEQVKDLDDEIENDKLENAYYGRPRGIGRGPTRGVGGINRSVNRGPTRGSGSMQAVFKKSESNNQQIKTRSHKPSDILHIQDVDNFLNCNTICDGEWTWYHIMNNTINITTYELLKESHGVIARLIDINLKFITIMNFKNHITNVIVSLINILENLKTTKSEYDDTVVRDNHDIFISHSADIITTYSSVINAITSDVKQLKLNFTLYQDEFKVLSSNEHIIAATQDTYLYDIFATQQTNHTTLITLIESFDKEFRLCPMKDEITKLFTPKINIMSL